MDKLNNYRKQIDKIDHKILETLYKRFEVVEKIGRLKKELGQPALDKKRWQKVLKNRIALGKKYNLPESFITSIYEEIHIESLRREK